MRFLNLLTLLAGATASVALSACSAQALTPKKAPIETRWASQVSTTNPLPEYPRPQLARREWLSLNGVWQYKSGANGDAAPIGQNLGGEILVPFPVESALSGVMEHHDRLWYRRTFSVPRAWNGRQLMLHFGAVDYQAEVFVNGQSVGVHEGGYVPFSYDISKYLRGTGPQELIVRVFDPTDLGGQPRGKQTLTPQGIMYTPTTGIWQTVWLEPVARTSIQNLKMVPDIDRGALRLTVNAANATAQTRATVTIRAAGRVLGTVAVRPNIEVAIPIRNARLWTPDTPFLYDVDVALTQNRAQLDRVSSYFGMRKISVGQVNGVPRLLLNNKFIFQMGPLDQGFWPESLYTPPTDAAMIYDIAETKRFGFNMTRKHIKVEPARWYYHCDRLGLLVWQDMPSPNSYTSNPAPLDKPAFEKQLNEVITSLWNSPAIVMWVVFNEGQARHDTAKLVNIAKALDPSRLVNRDSGGGNEGDVEGQDGAVGDIDDVHNYPPPAAPTVSPNPKQALVCGEYGGIGYILKGHTWKSEGWGYTTINSAQELEDLYGEFTGILKQLRDERGLSAAVYTEISDVEIEINGLMTYDRLIKCDPAKIALANRFAYPLPTYIEFVPTSEKAAQTWRYTFAQPARGWEQQAFDDAAWQTGAGGFGTAGTPGIGQLGTTWNTSDIWMRRTFRLGNLSAQQVAQMVVRNHHDEDVEVYINGVLAYKAGGHISAYEYKPITVEAQRALVLGGDNVLAVHCRQSAGGQYIDVGLFQKIPAKF